MKSTPKPAPPANTPPNFSTGSAKASMTPEQLHRRRQRSQQLDQAILNTLARTSKAQ
jgi:hypothetical protein